MENHPEMGDFIKGLRRSRGPETIHSKRRKKE